MSSEVQYLWGTPDAYTVWCEGRTTPHAISPYIVEFWNSISSIPIVLAGVFVGKHMGVFRSRCDKIYILIPILLCITGIGSMLFHTTLRRWAQIADEIPMLWSMLYILFFMASLNVEGNGRKRVLVVILVVIDVLYAVYYFTWRFEVFLFSFAILSISNTVWLGYAAYAPDSASTSLSISTRPKELADKCRKHYVRYIGGYLVAFTAWNIDNLYCDYIGFLKLHSLWHLGVSYLVYNASMCMYYVREKSKHIKSD